MLTERTAIHGNNIHADGHVEHDLRRRVADLERLVEHLREAVTSHERIGVATGLLAHRLDCSPGQAWALLVRLSQTTNVKVRDVAQVMIDVQAGQLCDADKDLASDLARLLPHSESGLVTT